jgi:hypothetical protein
MKKINSMKTGIIGVLNNPATSENSHSAGMVNIVRKLFNADVLKENDDWDSYDQLIIYHGVNFRAGKFNIIGGINDQVLLRAKKLNNYKGDLYSLDGFQLNDFSKVRKLNLYDDAQNIELIKLPKRKNLVIGDSHSLSIWPNENYEISRNDGKTLFGFLKLNMDLSDYDHIIMYFGNIDLRYHLARQEDPIEATKKLFTNYVNYASKYNVTLTTLLHVEHESRKIPQSGQYKGQNFFGSMELRKQIRLVANKIITESGLKYIEWPESYLDEEGNLSFDAMEPKQSVHLRPKFYINNVKQPKLF